MVIILPGWMGPTVSSMGPMILICCCETIVVCAQKKISVIWDFSYMSGVNTRYSNSHIVKYHLPKWSSRNPYLNVGSNAKKKLNMLDWKFSSSQFGLLIYGKALFFRSTIQIFPDMFENWNQIKILAKTFSSRLSSIDKLWPFCCLLEI